MKTILFTAAFAFLFMNVNAQKMKATEVPAAVTAKFATLYPNVKDAEWEKEGANYEAEFDVNKTETSCSFDASGNLLQTETEISVSELPQAVKDYFTKNAPGKKIKEASKMVDPSGTISYEAEVDETDYIFDASGNFVSKEVEVENDRD